LPLCTGKERLKINGEKAHPTQKPEALLERVILSSTNHGDLILDPFFGSGTTGAVAKKLGRHWIGIEAVAEYISIAQQRINSISEICEIRDSDDKSDRNDGKRIPFSALLQYGCLQCGQVLYFGSSGDRKAIILADGQINYRDFIGSIHKVGREIAKAPCNGWMAWYYIDKKTGNREPIDVLRKQIREYVYLESSVKAEISGDDL
jgi:hypothetical protein